VSVCGRVRRAALAGRAVAEALLFGEHPLSAPGPGLEYVDLREYAPDDDFRRIDWRASARTGLEKLFVREYRAERSVRLLYLVDLTSSMSFKGKPEALAFTLALHARISDALRDEVALVTVGERVEFSGFSQPTVALERVLRRVCERGMRGSLDLGSALPKLAGYARGLPVAVYTDYSNDPGSYAGIARLARASGGSARFYLFATPGETGAPSRGWSLPLYDLESGLTSLSSLAEFAARVRRHVALVRSLLPPRCIVEVPVLNGGRPPVRPLVTSYMSLRARM